MKYSSGEDLIEKMTSFILKEKYSTVDPLLHIRHSHLILKSHIHIVSHVYKL